MFMVKVKTKELSRKTLNWVVATLEGVGAEAAVIFQKGAHYQYGSSADLSVPIFEREGISVKNLGTNNWRGYNGKFEVDSPSFLEAGLRCFVAMRLGDEVKVPVSITDRDYREKLNEITATDVDQMVFDDIYKLRVQQLEDEGMTTSDAQGCADYEDANGTMLSNVIQNLGKFKTSV
jgi:hypothetical protein